jgi:hypothetical protein
MWRLRFTKRKLSSFTGRLSASKLAFAYDVKQAWQIRAVEEQLESDLKWSHGLLTKHQCLGELSFAPPGKGTLS